MLGEEGIIRNLINDAWINAKEKAMIENIHYFDNVMPELIGLRQNFDIRVCLLPIQYNVHDIPHLQNRRSTSCRFNNC